MNTSLQIGYRFANEVVFRPEVLKDELGSVWRLSVNSKRDCLKFDSFPFY